MLTLCAVDGDAVLLIRYKPSKKYVVLALSLIWPLATTLSNTGCADVLCVSVLVEPVTMNCVAGTTPRWLAKGVKYNDVVSNSTVPAVAVVSKSPATNCNPGNELVPMVGRILELTY